MATEGPRVVVCEKEKLKIPLIETINEIKNILKFHGFAIPMVRTGNTDPFSVVNEANVVFITKCTLSDFFRTGQKPNWRGLIAVIYAEFQYELRNAWSSGHAVFVTDNVKWLCVTDIIPKRIYFREIDKPDAMKSIILMSKEEDEVTYQRVLKDILLRDLYHQLQEDFNLFEHYTRALSCCCLNGSICSKCRETIGEVDWNTFDIGILHDILLVVKMCESCRCCLKDFKYLGY